MDSAGRLPSLASVTLGLGTAAAGRALASRRGTWLAPWKAQAPYLCILWGPARRFLNPRPQGHDILSGSFLRGVPMQPPSPPPASPGGAWSPAPRRRSLVFLDPLALPGAGWGIGTDDDFPCLLGRGRLSTTAPPRAALPLDPGASPWLRCAS